MDSNKPVLKAPELISRLGIKRQSFDTYLKSCEAFIADSIGRTIGKTRWFSIEDLRDMAEYPGAHQTKLVDIVAEFQQNDAASLQGSSSTDDGFQQNDAAIVHISPVGSDIIDVDFEDDPAESSLLVQKEFIDLTWKLTRQLDAAENHLREVERNLNRQRAEVDGLVEHIEYKTRKANTKNQLKKDDLKRQQEQLKKKPGEE